MKKQNKKGFTLVELVIVIAVIAILAAVLIPTFTTVIDNANKSAAEQEGSSLKTEILTLYQGEFDKYCEDRVATITSSASDPKTVTSDQPIIPTLSGDTPDAMTKYPKGTERPTTTFGEFLSIESSIDITIKYESNAGEISYKVGNYTVTITATSVTATK